MSKRVRQYIGILLAIAAYYVVHEGAHLIYALCVGAFRQIRFPGPGFGLLLLINGYIFWKMVLPRYKDSFAGDRIDNQKMPIKQ